MGLFFSHSLCLFCISFAFSSVFLALLELFFNISCSCSSFFFESLSTFVFPFLYFLVSSYSLSPLKARDMHSFKLLVSAPARLRFEQDDLEEVMFGGGGEQEFRNHASARTSIPQT